MSLEEAFEHLEKGNESGGRSVDHQDRAVELAREFIEEELDFEAEISVHRREPEAFGVEIVPRSITEMSSTVVEDLGLVALSSPIKMRLSRERDIVYTDESGRREAVKQLVREVSSVYEDDPGAPRSAIADWGRTIGLEPEEVEDELNDLFRRGWTYEPKKGYVSPMF